MFKSSSAGDLGTLYQLKCKLNKKDVTDKVTKSYHGCEAFFSTVLDGYITYAAMEYFGMPSPHENPSKSIPSRHTGSDAHFFEEVGKMVDTFILQKHCCWKMLPGKKPLNNSHVTDVGTLDVTGHTFMKKGVTTMS